MVSSHGCFELHPAGAGLGAEPSEKTEVTALHTRDALFLGIRCFDSDPSGILASQRSRDNGMDSDDSVWIVLDTMHAHRDAYFFRVNPLGNQWDALISDEGRVQNPQWDGRWEAAAVIQSWGWSAEIRIPFKILKMPSADESLTLGMDFRRFLRRRNEIIAWNNYLRDFEFVEISKAGHLSGVGGDINALSLQVKPYVAGGFLSSKSGTSETRDPDLDAGLENLRYTFTSELKLDATLNPDFAQAEVDNLQVNLTRFPLFFQERREFFLEDSGLFQLNYGGQPGMRDPNELRLFHSRRIGLTPGGEQIPILFGARLTGENSGGSFGVMNVQVRDQGNSPATNMGVYRVRKNILSRSYIGALATHLTNERESSSAIGLDARVLLFDNLTIQSLVSRTEGDEDSQDGWAGLPIHAAWASDLFELEAGHLIIEENFQPSLGFVRRTDIRKTIAGFEYRPRPRIDWMRQIEFELALEYITDMEGTLQTRFQSAATEFNFQNGDNLQVAFERILERLEEPFSIAGLPVPAGIYNNDGWDIRYRRYNGNRFSGVVQLSRGEFWDGDRTTVSVRPQARWSDTLSTSLDYQLEKVSLGAGDFSSSLIDGALIFNLSNQWLTRTTVQYGGLDDEWGIHFRLNYIYRPGDDFFFVVNSGRTPDIQSWSLLVKLTHTFDF